MKTKLLIAAVMFLALSVAAFAQATAQFTVGSIPVTTVASCGTTEHTGDIIFTTVEGTGAVQSGTFTINYGVPITNPTNPFPGTAVVGISTPTVSIGGGTGSITATFDPVLNPQSALTAGLLTITIKVTGTVTNPVQIVLSGVRVNVSTAPTLTNLTASISSTGNAIVAGQTSVIVISSIAPALDTLTITDFATIGTGVPPSKFGKTLSTGAGINAATGAFTPADVSGAGALGINVKEKFVTAFEAPATAGGPNGSLGSLVQLTFSAIPAGVTISLPATATSDQGYGFTLVSLTPDAVTGAISASSVAAVGKAVTLSSTSTNLSVYYQATTPGANSSTAIDTLMVGATIAVSSTATFPINAGTITVTAQMAPPSPAGSTYIPRYTSTGCQIGPATVASISTGQTFLLMTYAVNTLGYDTALSVANTTSDNPPLSATTTPTGAAKQNGTLTFTFFPQATAAQITAGTAPASFSYTTSSTTTKGTGLTSAGVLNSGNTYTVLLSDLLGLAAQTTTGATAGTFQGYVIVTCNFTNAHGQYNIVNFTNGSSIGSVLMGVFAVNRTSVPESLGN